MVRQRLLEGVPRRRALLAKDEALVVQLLDADRVAPKEAMLIMHENDNVVPAVGIHGDAGRLGHLGQDRDIGAQVGDRSEEHTSELQSLMRISYAVFCLKKKKKTKHTKKHRTEQNIKTIGSEIK